MGWRDPVFAMLLAAGFGLPAQAEAPLLHPMFQDHAVLQRGAPIHVYGQTTADARVTVRLGAATASIQAGHDGHWDAMLLALPEGGPYTLEADSSAGAHQTARDVMVGDVFLCTGQSNMQLQVRRAGNAEAEMASATDGAVREFTINRTASSVTLATFATPVQWVVELPQTAGDFSASCFYFARELRKRVHVPVGLVVAAWGGTRDRGWLSEASLRALGHDNEALDLLDLYRRDPDAAMQRWDASWQAWWRAHGKGEPWNGATADWQMAPAGLGPWVDYPGLSLPDGTTEPGVGFVGQMWLGTHVRLTAAQVAQPAVLDLGHVNEEDESWINGHGVGGTSQQPLALHTVPPGVLKAGENSIVTNIFCSWKNCGLSGPDASRAIRFRDGSSVVLDQPWHYQPVAELIAPQLPWGPMHGATLQYNGMIAPIGPYGFKGALWYQGESNIYFAAHYQATVTAMMADWRRQFGAALPFLVVQIPNYGPTPTRPVESLWSDVREAQRRIVMDDAHSALVVTVDIGDPTLLHPTNKQDVGRRLAIAARHAFYGEAIAPSGPRAVTARHAADGIHVAFGDVTGALLAYSGAPNAFELCGTKAENCRFVPAHISGKDVVLSGDEATRVRYCWGDSPICTLSDASGLPAGPFELAVTQ